MLLAFLGPNTLRRLSTWIIQNKKGNFRLNKKTQNGNLPWPAPELVENMEASAKGILNVICS